MIYFFRLSIRQAVQNDKLTKGQAMVGRWFTVTVTDYNFMTYHYPVGSMGLIYLPT